MVISLWTLASWWVFYVFVFVHVGPKHMVNLFLTFIFSKSMLQALKRISNIVHSLLRHTDKLSDTPSRPSS